MAEATHTVDLDLDPEYAEQLAREQRLLVAAGLAAAFVGGCAIVGGVSFTEIDPDRRYPTPDAIADRALGVADELIRQNRHRPLP